MKKNEKVNYLKGIAIFAIIIYHIIAFFLDTNSLIKKISAFGGAGVHVFFLLSGFGLYYLYNKRKIKYKDFIFTRFVKIYLPYIFIIILSSFTTYIDIGSDKIEAMFSHIFLYKMFIEGFTDSFGIQFWYISTLFQFYIFFYLIIKLKNICNDNKKFLAISIIISLIYSTIISIMNLSSYRVISSFFLQYLWEFSLGIVWADKYINGKEFDVKNKNLIIGIITALAFIVYAILSLKGGWLKNFNDIFSLTAFLGISYFIGKIKFIYKIFVYMSKISYEMYLLHYLILKTIFTFFDAYIPNFLLCAIAFILIIIISIIYKGALNIIYERNNKNEKSYACFWNKTRSN